MRVCVYYSVKLNQSWELFHQDKKTIQNDRIEINL